MEKEKTVVDVCELKAKIAKKGMSINEFLKETGIKKEHFYRALNSKSSFDQNEIKATMLVLGLSASEIVDIFLR